MTQPELNQIVSECQEKFWPRWTPEPGKIGWIGNMLRHANHLRVRDLFLTYAHEHVDEDRPKTLWSYVLAEAGRRNLMGTDIDIDIFGNSRQQRDNIGNAILEARARGRLDDRTVPPVPHVGDNPTAAECYHDWTRRVDSRHYGAPFFGAIDWALGPPSLVVIQHHKKNGTLAAHYESIAERRAWYWGKDKIDCYPAGIPLPADSPF